MNTKKIIFSIFLFLIFFVLGFWRFNVDPKIKGNDDLNKMIGKSIEMQGFIVDDPEYRIGFSRFTLKTKYQNHDYFIQAKSDPYTKFYYGDKITAIVKLKKPENFLSQNGKEVNYIKMLAKDNIFYQADVVYVKQSSHNNLSHLKYFLFKLKNKFIDSYRKNLSEPESSLIAGILFGDKSGFTDSYKQSFINSGTIHIVALSGYNITILAEFVMSLLSLFLSFTISSIFGILIIVLFVIMTGMTSTAIRSAIMALFAIMAKRFGMTSNASRALFIAGFIMLLINPMLLVYDISFQLSFLATFGLIYLSPIFEKKLLFVTSKFELRGILATTISATIITLPFLLYKIGYVSVVSVFSNILILSFMPFTMLLGFIASLLSFISINFLFISLNLILKYESFIAVLFGSFKFSLFKYNFPLFLAISSYIAIILWIYFYYRKERKETGRD